MIDLTYNWWQYDWWIWTNQVLFLFAMYYRLQNVQLQNWKIQKDWRSLEIWPMNYHTDLALISSMDLSIKQVSYIKNYFRINTDLVLFHTKMKRRNIHSCFKKLIMNFIMNIITHGFKQNRYYVSYLLL